MTALHCSTPVEHCVCCLVVEIRRRILTKDNEDVNINTHTHKKTATMALIMALCATDN